MSRLFGPMRQIGIVVRDIEKAMRHWVEVCGIGPWFYAEQLPLTEFRYKGRVYDIKMSVALANSGDVQLELIQQRCDSPSLYRDFLAAGHEGMQHWSSWPAHCCCPSIPKPLCRACPGHPRLERAPTAEAKDVGARHKAGHGE